jgi:hypothetical protein
MYRLGASRLCVEGKVEHDKLDLIRIDKRRPQPRLCARLKADRGSDRQAERGWNNEALLNEFSR